LWISRALWICALAISPPFFPAPGGVQSPIPASAVSDASAAAAQRLTLPGVHNVGKVSEFLYRGSRPNEQGFSALKKLGVGTVVNLEGFWANGNERREVESLGMRYVNIPLGGWSTPSPAAVAQFLELVRDNADQKIFVHCRFGDDRTGVMIATYRMWRQNWTPEQALAEMHAFHYHSTWHPGLAKLVRKFPELSAADPAFASLRRHRSTSADPPPQ
jgi:protein tyrosine/serine phosphatase